MDIGSASIACILALAATGPARAVERPALVDAAASAGIAVDMRYSGTDNFLHADVYGDFATCLLLPQAAAMLAEAQKALATRLPGHRLLAFDCTRPREVQDRMWAKVEGTPSQRFVADPKSISVHAYGCAIDLSIQDDKGHELDLGTPFDFFGPEAEPSREISLLRAGKLAKEQIARRLVLREAMVSAGFLPLPHEWWHFDCMEKAQLLKTAQPVDKLSDVLPKGGHP